MNYVHLIGERSANYGLIHDNTNIELLRDYSKKNNVASFPVLIADKVATILEIQGEYAFMRGEYSQGIQEYNDSLRLFTDNKTARWSFLEIEYKFNIKENIDKFFSLFSTLKLDGFDITCLPQDFNSIETMFHKYSDSYFSLLKWEGDEYHNAIKIKKTISNSPILSRKSIILDYNKKSLSRVFSLFKIDLEIWEKYNLTFYKKKKRHIAIDSETGHVFGVSCNISHIDENVFCQVEIEYWSKILPLNSLECEIQRVDNSVQIESHMKLVNSMRIFFAANKIIYVRINA